MILMFDEKFDLLNIYMQIEGIIFIMGNQFILLNYVILQVNDNVKTVTFMFSRISYTYILTNLKIKSDIKPKHRQFQPL